MRGVARELSLGREALVQSRDHVVERRAATRELGGDVLVELGDREVVGAHVLYLRGKVLQRSQCSPAGKVREHAARQRHRGGNAPARRAERLLGAAHDDGDLVSKSRVRGVERKRAVLLGPCLGER